MSHMLFVIAAVTEQSAAPVIRIIAYP
jgi:hypothetical protein